MGNADPTHQTPHRSGSRLRFLTIGDIADAVAVSPRTVRRWIGSGDLVAHPFHGVVRIAEGDLGRFLAAHRNQEPDR